MKGFTLISVSDLPTKSESEIKAQLAKKRAAYRKSLRDLCPSKEMRQQAKRISKRDDSCETCVYCDGETGICHYPHSDLYIEDMNIDPCYEGVLKYMVKTAKEKRKIETAFKQDIYNEVSKSPETALEIVMNDMEIICMLSGWILSIIDDKLEMSPLTKQVVQGFYDTLSEALPPLSADSIGLIKNEQQ